MVCQDDLRFVEQSVGSGSLTLPANNTVSEFWRVSLALLTLLVTCAPQRAQTADSQNSHAAIFILWKPLFVKSLFFLAIEHSFLVATDKGTRDELKDDLALRKRLIQAWSDGNGIIGHYPKRSDWSVEISNNGPSIAAGGGLDVVITRPFAWRLINLEYNHTWMSDVAMIRPQNSLRVSTGAVLRIGTW